MGMLAITKGEMEKVGMMMTKVNGTWIVGWVWGLGEVDGVVGTVGLGLGWEGTGLEMGMGWGVEVEGVGMVGTWITEKVIKVSGPQPTLRLLHTQTPHP